MLARRTFAVGLGLALLGACGPIARPDGGKGLLPVGAMAPEVVGKRPDGSVARLSALRGHQAVVYFYPADETPGCTKEACAFRDAFKEYEALGVTIFGVSRDSAESHDEFQTKHALPFPLVADENGALSRAYGVSSTFGLDSRVTFLVGVDGRIAHVWPDVDPGVHAKEVIAAARAGAARTSTN
ncbi:MAG TPA: peroxiredoxin [Polyangiaceae bacterium]|nr:peroxiredoxin [Polyangiaceae bacterium]